MKIFHTILLAAVAALLVASCSDESGATLRDGQPVEARFTTNLNNGWVMSRALDTSWSANDSVGIVAVANGEALTADDTFVKYQVTGTTAPVNLVAANSEETIYYPTDDSQVNFIAFYPFQKPDADNKVTYSLIEQETLAEMEAVNFLYHKGTTAYSQANGETATLNFAHKMSKLTIELTTVEGDAAIDLSEVNAIAARHLPPSITFDLKDGSFTSTSFNSLTSMYLATKETTSCIAQAIVAPHNAKSGRTLTVSTAAKDETYLLPNELAFEAGKAYTLKFELTKNGLRMVGKSSTDWTDDFINWGSDGAISSPKSTVVVGKDKVIKHSLSFKTAILEATDVSVTYSDSPTDAAAGVADGWLEQSTAPVLAGSGTGYEEYTYAFKTANNAGALRKGYIHIKVANVTQVIEVQQRGAPNSYILKPGGELKILVDRANVFTRSIGAADAITGAFDVEVLWSDAQDLVTLNKSGTGKNGILAVTAATGKTGNAVVAAKVDGKVVWSWHIWVTDYAPNPATNNGWMDRNLGAVNATPGANGSTGLYYQWGRKDPFPGSATAAAESEPVIYPAGTVYKITVEHNPQSMAWTVENPFIFIGPNAGAYSWMENSTKNDTNWNSADNKKTLFDPCPEGYRVPQRDAWKTTEDWSNFTWDNTTKGRDTGATFGGWYSAAGRRHDMTGALGNVGDYGYYRTNVPSGANNTYYLVLGQNTLSPQNVTVRSSGYSVRCIADK